MTTRQGRFADDQLYYRVWDAQTPRATIVLAHGYAEHSGRYEHVGDAFADAGFTTWALDHFGHGQSTGNRADIGSLSRAVANLDAFVDLVEADGARGRSPRVTDTPKRPRFLVGHSMGGLIATAYTEKHQDRLDGLILSGAALHVAPELLALRELEEIPALPLAPLVSRDPEVVKDYENDPLNYLGPMPRPMLDAFAEIPAIREGVSGITIPILVMHGDADALVPVQAAHDVAAQAGSGDVTLKIWPGLYHEIYNEPEQAEVIATTIDWINARL